MKKIIFVLLIFISCQNKNHNKNISSSHDLIQVFLADPISNLYVIDTCWKTEITRKINEKGFNTISIEEYNISRTTLGKSIYKLYVYTNKNFKHIYSDIDEYYYNNYNHMRFVNDSSLMKFFDLKNCSLEKHLNYIIENDKSFITNNKIDYKLIRDFLIFYMTDIKGLIRIDSNNYNQLILAQKNRCYKYYIDDLKTYNDNIKKIIQNIENSKYLYFINNQSVYEIKIEKTFNKIIQIKLLNDKFFWIINF